MACRAGFEGSLKCRCDPNKWNKWSGPSGGGSVVTRIEPLATRPGSHEVASRCAARQDLRGQRGGSRGLAVSCWSPIRVDHRLTAGMRDVDLPEGLDLNLCP
jgi:hypothetical protein